MRLNSVFAVIVSASLGVLALSSIGCGDGSGSSTGGSGGTGGSTGGSTGGTTAGSPCDPACDANKGIASACVAIEDNSAAATYGLRMSQLTINKPDELTAAKNPVVAGIIAKGVTMNLPDCNLNGGGTFSWLLQFDSATGKLKTGGATIQDDPTAGYCFVNGMLGATAVAPLTVDATPDADGKFSVAVGGNVVVPIFLTDENNYVLLPLSNAKIINATLSADHNCIGKYNADKLDPANQCLPPEFTNAASLDAFITLEDADTVPIESLGKSLCALLTKTDDGGTPKKCPRDAGTNKITSKGDWCSTTDAAATADCADAFKLGADFAASAVKITGDCK